jgi:predicted nucleotidyltransferase
VTVLDACVAELVEVHGCHTVILYGSHARGDATPASDFDLAGLRAAAEPFRIAHTRHGGYLDAFVYPEDVAVDEEFLKLRGGRILVQHEGLGDRLLARVEELYLAGPKRWTPDERVAIHAWIGKMIPRIAQGDIEGDFRRVMLLYELLEDYFKARDLWYFGPKVSFIWLQQHEPATFRLFQEALRPDASLAAIEALARAVQAEF